MNVMNMSEWSERDKARMLRERQLQLEYGLSIRESEIIAARELGMTNDDIADELGIQKQTVCNTVVRARMKGAHIGRD